MRTHRRSVIFLLGCLGSASALAAEYPIDIDTDVKGKYFVVEKGGTPNKPTLVVKRVRTHGNHYIKREFDCQARNVRILGDGETPETMAKSQAEPKPSPLIDGSIADQLARHVCPNQ